MSRIEKVTPGQRAFSKSSSDLFHMSVAGRSLCGKDTSDWLRMGEIEDHDMNSPYLCSRCYKRAMAPA